MTYEKPVTLQEKLRGWRDALLLQEDLNFLLTNRVPRLALTRFIGWFSQIRHPWVRDASIAVWRLFTDLDLKEAKATRFASLHEVFIRELREGARPLAPDPAVLVSPCDGIVGACGRVDGTRVFQAKGFPYTMEELFGPTQDVSPWRDGHYVTLRLTSTMYHRFHAPADATLHHLTFHRGDTWNVNPIALERIERLFCRNERAVLRLRLAPDGLPVALVPVAAILVASLRLHGIDELLDSRYRGPTERPLDRAVRKGQELGWFQHGSTILVFLPPGTALAPGVETGRRLRMGEPLARRALPEPSDRAV